MERWRRRVPANIVLKKIVKGNGRFATVGLSCHVHGIRKAELICKELAKKIVLHLGLFCNHTPTFLATIYQLQRMNLKKEDVKRIDYRGEGWPGGMSVTLKDDRKKFIPEFNPFYWGHVFSSYFFQSRCILCIDKISRLSDISFGDAWNLSNSKIGESVIISRSRIGEELLKKAAIEKKIEIKRTPSRKVIESQGLDSIRREQNARILVFKKLGKAVPIYNQETSEPNPLYYAKALLLCLKTYVSSKRHLWNLIGIYPSALKFSKGIDNG